MSSFGWALKELGDGHRVRRAGWNGKGMWLAIVPDWSGRIGLDGSDMPADWEGYAPFTVLYGADKRLTPWTCSQADQLALDWELA